MDMLAKDNEWKAEIVIFRFFIYIIFKRNRVILSEL